MLTGAYWYQQQTRRADDGADTHKMTFGSYALDVEFARTNAEHRRGLMHRYKLDEDSGMLFLFAESGQKIFWNKNTYIPLDVIWLYENQVIGISQLPAISEGLVTISSPPNTNRVLEVNRGWSARHGIQIGARMW